MEQRYVYIAGPYTTPDPIDNASLAMQEAAHFRDAGHAVFLPHLFFAWQLTCPADYEVWMDQCLAWVRRCDLVFRLPGKSPGADREVQLAKDLGIPVFRSTGSALKFLAIAKGLP